MSTQPPPPILLLLVWLWLVVNDRKFPTRTVFFSNTNQPTILFHKSATIRTSLPNVLLVTSRPRATASTPLSTSPFDAALAALQSRVGYAFRAPSLLRRAMTHASYSRENGRALAVLGLAADRDAAPSAVSRAASGAAWARAGAHLGIPDVVRVAGRTSASAPTVVCGALRALVGAVAVDANSTDAAGEVFWRLHALTSSAAVAAV